MTAENSLPCRGFGDLRVRPDAAGDRDDHGRHAAGHSHPRRRLAPAAPVVVVIGQTTDAPPRRTSSASNADFGSGPALSAASPHIASARPSRSTPACPAVSDVAHRGRPIDCSDGDGISARHRLYGTVRTIGVVFHVKRVEVPRLTGKTRGRERASTTGPDPRRSDRSAIPNPPQTRTVSPHARRMPPSRHRRSVSIRASAEPSARRPGSSPNTQRSSSGAGHRAGRVDVRRR